MNTIMQKMNREKGLRRSVRARRDEGDRYGSSTGEDHDVDDTDGRSDESEESYNKTETDEDVDESSAEEEPSPPLQTISFGALAKAQESLSAPPPPPRPGKRKRALDTETETDTNLQSTQQDDAAGRSRPTKSSKPSQQHRSSKHAPQTLSTRHAVPRTRTIIEPAPTLKSRDPRFDPRALHPSGPDDAERANQNYAFLTTYRQSELQTLQSQLRAAQNPPAKKKTRGSSSADPDPDPDPEKIAALKREIMSLTSKLATSESRTREREIQRAHRAREREALRAGRKSRPYYLKRGAVRAEMERERTEGMGRRAREKRELRRRKREKGREGRGLPRARRVVGV